jgi:hypothetical protein
MGGLEVVLIQNVVGLDIGKPSIKNNAYTYIVKYLNPFYGVTNSAFQGNDSKNFNDVQKSYGMWMIPPDIGTTVMVIFVDGDPNQGYWMGCVQDQFQNHMVPGIAASEYTDITPEQRRKYGTDFLPVGEFLKSKTLASPDIDKIKKPVHPFAERLLEQGLILDKVRGVTSSSARREYPSNVFGISTPGPLDTNGPYERIGLTGNRKAPVSRLGGTTFVMDDGDADGNNELVRIRTRTGHQILMHNTKDLVYIANSKGTSWIELTSNGKIDVYAADSVSIHTEQDFNFRAGGNINMEAGGNINLKSGGNFQLDSVGNATLNVNESGILTFKSLDVHSNSDTKLTSGGNTNIKSGGSHLESASEIHMNGPAAESAAKASSLATNTLPGPAAIGTKPAGPDVVSIVTRAPTHEPWPDHESK